VNLHSEEILEPMLTPHQSRSKALAKRKVKSGTAVEIADG
jgi:hypothetical protein